MMNKVALIFLCGFFGVVGIQAAELNEWTFELDPAGRTLSQATNSGVEAAVFSAGGAGFLETDGMGKLMCIKASTGGTGMWTNGAVLNAAVADATGGVYYLRLDLGYQISSDSSNDTGSATGLSFVDSDGSTIAGLFLLNDSVSTPVPAGATETSVAQSLPLSGAISVIAKVDLTAKTMGVWYRLDAAQAFDELSPSVTNVAIAIDSISALRFQATGAFRLAGSSDYVGVENMRMASSWDAIAAAVPETFITVHNMFHDHMVLQRNIDVPVWGKGTSGATVNILLDDVQVGSAVVDTNGNWIARLTPHANDSGISHVLKIEAIGAATIQISDVIYGDVYLASGQSNMAFLMANVTGFAETFANDTNSCLRQVIVEKADSPVELYEPVYNYAWASTTPTSVRTFSAVAYLFSKNLYEKTGVPVGIINAAYGGQEINRFLNPTGMAMVPELAGLQANYEQGGITTNLYDIYNAMIGPVVPYGICGFLWYQGEADRSAAGMYESKMRALMRGLRAVWGEGNLPFYYFQLPNYGTTDYPTIREDQLRALSETNSGMAVTIDVGDDGNIHPTNKQDPGYRLAQWALARQFGRNIVYSGPLYRSRVIEGATIRVLFDYADGGLLIGQKVSTNQLVEVFSGALQNFEIAGTNRVFVSATATIDADSVIVSSPSVSAPQYVRYCYADAPAGTNKLYNRAKLPASPFRTDEFYILTLISGTYGAEGILPGTVRSITASTPPSGKVFDRWIGAAGEVANINSSSTTVTMPSHDLYLTATYRDSASAAYSVNVGNGSGDSSAQQGAVVNVVADPPPAGMVFAGWTGSGAGLLADTNSASTTLRMPASTVSISATYRTADAKIPPVLTQFKIAGTQAQMRFSGENGSYYRFERSTNLLNNAWIPILYNIKGDGFEKQLTDSVMTNGKAFYRLMMSE